MARAVTPLDRALALVQVENRAGGVAEDLDLDVARSLEVLLDVEIAAAEGGFGAPPHRRERGGRAGGLVHARHADTTAAGRRLEEDGVADVARDPLRRRDVRERLGAPRDDGDARRRHESARFGLVAHALDRLGRRPDEHDPGAAARVGEAPVLGEEPVAGVNRVRAALARRREDALGVEIARTRRRRADRDRAVGLPHVG